MFCEVFMADRNCQTPLQLVIISADSDDNYHDDSSYDDDNDLIEMVESMIQQRPESVRELSRGGVTMLQNVCNNVRAVPVAREDAYVAI